MDFDPLDDTRVHPESYNHAIAIAKSAVGGDQDVAVENALAHPQVSEQQAGLLGLLGSHRHGPLGSCRHGPLGSGGWQLVVLHGSGIWLRMGLLRSSHRCGRDGKACCSLRCCVDARTPALPAGPVCWGGGCQAGPRAWAASRHEHPMQPVFACPTAQTATHASHHAPPAAPRLQEVEALELAVYAAHLRDSVAAAGGGGMVDEEGEEEEGEGGEHAGQPKHMVGLGSLIDIQLEYVAPYGELRGEPQPLEVRQLEGWWVAGAAPEGSVAPTTGLWGGREGRWVVASGFRRSFPALWLRG